MLKFIPAAFFLAAASLAVPARADTQTLRFTSVPDRDESMLVKRFVPLADYLQTKLGLKVEYMPARSFRGAVRAFIQNDVQFAWFGGFEGLEARQAIPGSEAIIQTVEDLGFKTYLIANVSAGINSSKNFPFEIRGKTFTFALPDSTVGRIMPEYFIRQRFGTGPKEVFSRVGFSASHSATLRLVQSGECEVGAIDYELYEAKKKAGEVDESKVKVIWESPPFPNHQFSIRGDVDKTFGNGFSLKVKQALLDLDNPEILAVFGGSKFIPTDNAHYRLLEEVQRIVKLAE
jgi:phosphonate transport system substrate-binding protein